MEGVHVTVFVPYDGTPISTDALSRAQSLAEQSDERLVVATVAPHNRREAVEYGWLADDESFDTETVRTRLAVRVDRVAPAAEFVFEVADGRISAGGIARELRDIARAADASMVVVGSENVGRQVRPSNTVAGRVAARLETDLYVVQTADAGFHPLHEGH